MYLIHKSQFIFWLYVIMFFCLYQCIVKSTESYSISPKVNWDKFFSHLTFFRPSAIFLLLNRFDGEETAKFAQRGIHLVEVSCARKRLVPLPSIPGHNRNGPSRYRGHKRRIISVSRVEPWSLSYFTPESHQGWSFLFFCPEYLERSNYYVRQSVYL